MMRFVFKTIEYISLSIMILAMILVFIAIFSQRMAGISTFTVLSGSMEPTIKTGSFIITIPATDYTIGDIITRRTDKPNVTVTHRIVEKIAKDNEFIFHTKGDGNDSSDGIDIKKGDIIGKVGYSIPYAGYPVHFAKSKEGFILLIVIPMAFIIFDEVLNILSEVKRIREKKKKVEIPERGVSNLPERFYGVERISQMHIVSQGNDVFSEVRIYSFHNMLSPKKIILPSPPIRHSKKLIWG